MLQEEWLLESGVGTSYTQGATQQLHIDSTQSQKAVDKGR